MGLILLPQTKTRQPRFACPINPILTAALSSAAPAGIVQGVVTPRGVNARGVELVGSEVATKGSRETAVKNLGAMALPVLSRPSGPFTFLARMNLPYPNADNNAGSFIRFGSSGTEITLSFVAEVGYSRVQFAWRSGYVARLTLNYDVTSAQPDGLLRADWDGTTARILWNGEEVASGAPSGDLPVSGATNAFFDITATYVQTPRIFGVAYAQRMLPEEFGLRDFWGEVFVQDDTPIWFTDAGGGPTYTLTAAQSSFTLTGQSASLTAQRKLTAAQGSYTLSGQTSALKAGRKLAANQGSFTFTGQDTNLVYTPGSGPDYTLTSGHGSFALTGQDAALKVARKLVAAYTTYELDGQNATLTYSGNLHGFTQDQLDFIVEYVAAHTSKLYINAITGDVEYLINLGN